MNRHIAFVGVILIAGSVYAKHVDDAWAEVHDVRVDHNVFEDGMRGMRVHLDLTVHKLKGMDAYVAVFFNDANDLALRDNNRQHYSYGGDVAFYNSLSPMYEDTSYSDLALFIPYSELDLDPGTHFLTMLIRIIHEHGGEIQNLASIEFELVDDGDTCAVEIRENQ